MATTKTAEETRIAVRLPAGLAEHVASQTGPGGLYDNASEFIRDLIRHHAQKQQALSAAQAHEHQIAYKLMELADEPSRPMPDDFFDKMLAELAEERKADKEAAAAAE